MIKCSEKHNLSNVYRNRYNVWKILYLLNIESFKNIIKKSSDLDNLSNEFNTSKPSKISTVFQRFEKR